MRFFFFIFSFLFPLLLSAETIRIHHQQDFEALSEQVHAAIGRGEKSIEVVFDKGTYFFRENHLRLDEMDAPGVTLLLSGGGSVLLGATDPAYRPTDGFCALETGKTLSPFGPLRKARSVVEPSGKGCWRIRTREADRKESDCQDLYLVLTSWYRSIRCPVRSIRRGYVYFYSEESLVELNGDVRYGQVFPRYMFLNHPDFGDVSFSRGRIRSAQTPVHRSSASSFLTFWGGTFGRVEIKDFHFAGNGGDGFLLFFYRTRLSSVEVHHCHFSGIQNRVFSVHDLPGASFHDNLVEDCFRLAVYLDMFTRGGEVYANTFRNIGMALEGSAVMESLGKDMHVHDNVFENFTYAGILTGVHFTNENPVTTSGVIENNELYMTDAFRRRGLCLMDCGAIYIGTMNKALTIRNNVVHDFVGAKDYRGIFGDDGASNVTVCGNRIYRIGSPYCIDFRRVAEVEKRPDSYARRVNVGNRIYGNEVDGEIRFETRGGDDGCYKGTNYRIRR